MFLEHGFGAVRVADVARACGVTEKTVFNHFPTKEALLADRWDGMTASLCTQLSDPAVAPLDAALAVLEAELVFFTTPSSRPGTSVLGQLRRFRDLVRTTPSLLAHEYQALDRLRGAAAEALAQRTGTAAEDPEALITAAVLSGLWTAFFQFLYLHLKGGIGDAAQVHAGVKRDLRRAADVLRQGL